MKSIDLGRHFLAVVYFMLTINTTIVKKRRQNEKCHIGDNAKKRKIGGLAFLISFFIFTSLSYTLSIGLLAQIEVNILVAAIIIGIIAIVLFVPIYVFHMDCMVSHDREEAIALGYVMHDKKPEFIHYLEDDYFVCSNSAYFNDYDPIDFYEKSWIKNKKVYLLDSRLKNQIIDLDNYQRELKDIKSIPIGNKEIVAKRQYKKLIEQEGNTQNDWIDDLYKRKKTRLL